MFKGAGGIESLLKDGHKHFAGLDEAVLKNIEACKGLATITKSSLGPNGMNKLLVNHLDKHFVTSDTGTMVDQLEVQHPAARMAVMACKAQELECGDASNLVVVTIGALLEQAEELLKQGIHAADIVKGYELGRERAMKVLGESIVWTCDDCKDVAKLSKACKTSLSSKQVGYEDHIAELVAQACAMVMPSSVSKFDADNVRVAKIIGSSMTQSQVVNGMVHVRGAQSVIDKVENAKVAVFGGGIEMSGTESTAKVLIKDAESLKNFTKGEEDKMEEFVKGIADKGIKCVISGGPVSDVALHYLNTYKIMVLKTASKFELRRMCKTLNCPALVRLDVPRPDELGICDSIEVQEIGSTKVTIIRAKDTKISTLLLRGATANVMDEMERAIDDAVNVIKCTTKDGRFVPGAGATEIEMAHQLQTYGKEVIGMDQYAVLKFGEALEEVPKILSTNAGINTADMVTALYAAHARGEKAAGVDVESTGQVLDATENAILDHYESKACAMKLAIDTALTVLRVNHIIIAKQAGGPKNPAGSPVDDED